MNGNYQNDVDRYNLRSRSLRNHPGIEGEIPESRVSSRSPLYLYGYASPSPYQVDSSPHSSPGDNFPIPGPALNDVTSGMLTLLPPPSITQQSLSRRSLSASSSQESTSDGLFSQPDQFSEQRVVQSLQMTPSQGFKYHKSAVDSMNHVESRLEDECDGKYRFSLPSTSTIPMLDSTKLPTSLYYNNGFPSGYVPGHNGAHMDARPGNYFQERPSIPSPNWLSDPSSPDSSQNRVSIIIQDMSAVPGDLPSPFSSRDEAPPLSVAAITFPSVCPRCDNLDSIYPDANVWFLHYWKEHPPPAGSPAAWQPGPCIWEPCELRKSFRTHKAWLEHAHAVHYRRFRCIYCDEVKPFGSQNSLVRHVNTKHAEPIACARSDCPAKKGINLWRKDKRTNHEAKYHGPLICTVAGCPRGRVNGQNHGFSEQIDLNKHMKAKHRHLPTRSQSS